MNVIPVFTASFFRKFSVQDLAYIVSPKKEYFPEGLREFYQVEKMLYKDRESLERELDSKALTRLARIFQSKHCPEDLTKLEVRIREKRENVVKKWVKIRAVKGNRGLDIPHMKRAMFSKAILYKDMLQQVRALRNFVEQEPL